VAPEKILDLVVERDLHKTPKRGITQSEGDSSVVT
jgi:hypothetical protein